MELHWTFVPKCFDFLDIHCVITITGNGSQSGEVKLPCLVISFTFVLNSLPTYFHFQLLTICYTVTPRVNLLLPEKERTMFFFNSFIIKSYNLTHQYQTL